MAFVFRTPHATKENYQNLGPGAYNFQDIFTSKPIGYAPFTSTVERFSSEKKPNNSQLKKSEFNVPGPGAYLISKDLVTEKVLVSNVQNDMKIIEVPKESSVFKSKTEKLANRLETKDITPGPGHYTKDKDYSDLKKTSPPAKELLSSAFLSTNQEKNDYKHPNIALVEDLKTKNKQYQVIPSIPSLKEAFGYTESEARELALNKNPMLKFTGVGKDSIGPGQYEAKGSLDARGYSWWKSNSKRIASMKSQTLDLLGPGSYNPSLEIRNINKSKPTSAFLSKIERSDEKKQTKYMVGLQKKLNEQQKNNDDAGDGPFNISAVEEQLLRSQNNEIPPGPGHYHNEKLRSSLNIGSKPIARQNFGSSDIRFKVDMTSIIVGPGEYNPKQDVNSRRIKPRVKIPFISGIQRFDKKTGDLELGPGSYNPPISLENELIKKIQNGYKGNFGSMEKRFDEKKEIQKNQEVPGPGQYLMVGSGELKAEKSKGYVFKSKSERKAFGPDSQTPGIGTYELDYYNLNNSINRNLDYEPFVVVKKPPFNSSEPRFVHGFSINKETQSSDSQIKGEGSSFSLGGVSQGTKGNNSIMNSKGNPYEKVRKFNVKADRFNYKNETTPGPGEYRKNKGNTWNKKTFNILFAEL